MSNDLNLCHFIGRLGADPEQRLMASGDVVANFRIAVGWKSKDKEGAEWVSCVAFKKLAEIVCQYCRKGQQVYVSGKFRTRKWETKEGETRYSTEIVCDKLQMLGSSVSASRENADRPGTGRQDEETEFNIDDEIPF